jgi:hypothetical protein
MIKTLKEQGVVFSPDARKHFALAMKHISVSKQKHPEKTFFYFGRDLSTLFDYQFLSTSDSAKADSIRTSGEYHFLFSL